jgi:hypothetical protein
VSRATVEPAAAKPASAARVGLLQRCGQTPPTACPCEAEEDRQAVLHRWSSSPFAGAEPTAPQIVQEALRSRSQALEPRARARMESRFGRSFGHVRVHSDSVAVESARAVGALAYTVGPHVVFGHRGYAPETTRGDRLLAHELVHVVQQSSLPAGTVWRSLRIAADDSAAERAARSASARGVAAAPTVQRASFGEAVARFFGGGTFSDEELLDYLTVLDLTERIEDDYDSDNKARAVVDRWHAGDPRYALAPARKILLVQEMISGFTGDDDERAILQLLEGSKDPEVAVILNAVGEGTLRSNFHTDESDALDRFLAAWRERTGVRDDQDADAQRSAGKIARVIVDQEATQTVTAIYEDGHRETDICSTGKGRCCVDAAAGGTGAACSLHPGRRAHRRVPVEADRRRREVVDGVRRPPRHRAARVLARRRHRALPRLRPASPGNGADHLRRGRARHDQGGGQGSGPTPLRPPAAAARVVRGPGARGRDTT